MRDDLTDVTVVLDRSGSMASTADDARGGFNQLVSDQKAIPGDCTFSVVQFDDEYEWVFKGKALADVPDLTPENYHPRGTTALLDAMARTIDETGERLEAVSEDQRPGKVVIVVITDGYENASKTHKASDVMARVRRQEKEYGWQFVFIGANQDAIAEAAKYGISAKASMTYSADAKGTQGSYQAVSRSLGAFRTGASKSVCFDDEARKQASGGS